jgi:UDP-GlcNAc:undecaprenyl-phosphate GlcNAc-1-phosphate transferase
MWKVFVYAFMGSVIFTWVAIKAAAKLGILDRPDERKIHSRPTPLLGGVAVYAACMLAILLNYHFSLPLKGVVIGSSFILLSGLVDDVRGLSASVRLAVQIACSVLIIVFGVRLNIIPDKVPYATLIEAVITVLWMVGITNALNFMDGIDGLAAGLVVIASGAFFIIAYQTGQPYFAFLNAALAGSCMGFLLFNFHPAKIFLGDAGSSFLGFMIAALAVMGEWAEKRPIVALSIPILVLALLIFDTIYVTISRICRKKVRNFREWIEYVGRDHLHHRLLGLGFTTVQTVLFIYMISMAFALGALVLKGADVYQAVLLLSQAFFTLIIVSVLMLVGKNNLNKARSCDIRKQGIIDLKETG